MAETHVALYALIGVALLALIEGVAWSLESRRSHPPGVPATARLANLCGVVAVCGGITAVAASAVTLPIGDAAALSALAVAAIVLVVRLVLSLGSAASRS